VKLGCTISYTAKPILSSSYVYHLRSCPLVIWYVTVIHHHAHNLTLYYFQLFPRGQRLNDDILLSLARYTSSPAETSTLVLPSIHLAPSFSCHLCCNLELTFLEMASNFFVVIKSYIPTRFYCIINHVENIQLPFILKGMLNFWRHGGLISYQH
jgi:hypothetical protein